MNRQTATIKLALLLLVFTLSGAPTACSTPTAGAPTAMLPPTAAPPTVTPPPTATPAPTPTPDLALELQQGLRALHDGEYEAAIGRLQRVVQGTHEGYRTASLPALAQALFLNGDYRGVTALAELLPANPLSEADTALVQGLVARAHDALGEWPAAIAAYEHYLTLEDAAAMHVRLAMARAYKALQDPAHGLEQIDAIDQTALDPSTRADVLELQSELRQQAGDVDGAVAALDAILAFAQQPAYRGAITQRKGQLLVNADRTAAGILVLQEVLGKYRSTSGAYWALQTLDELAVETVDDLARGQILYDAGEYEAAIEALQRYRRANTGGYWSTAYYYEGLANYRLRRYDQALAALNTVIGRFAKSDVAGDAWMAYGRAYEASGEDPAAHYERFASLYPDHARAPEALWLAAGLAERRGDWAHAATVYHEIYTRHADYARASEAQFREGLAAYAARDSAAAKSRWERLLAGTTGAAQARLLTWLGLASAQAGDSAGARVYWQQAAAAAPQSYYGLRAYDLLAGVEMQLGEELPPTAAGVAPDEAQWQEIRAWVNGWTPTDSAADAPSEQAQVEQGRALWELHWTSEALSVYRRVQEQVYSDAPALLHLMEGAAAAEAHPITIGCAMRLLALGRAAGAADPPPALTRLAYPTAWSELVLREAAAQKVDPLLFFALMRQESLFQARVSSSAGAIGLAQIMPATGEWIAGKLGDDEYEVAWLQRPAVSVRYGLYYLSYALGLFERHWMAALAAYNGGPAAVARWTGDKPITDLDLFFETIAYSETRTYVQRVYEYYRRYEEIYRNG